MALTKWSMDRENRSSLATTITSTLPANRTDVQSGAPGGSAYTRTKRPLVGQNRWKTRVVLTMLPRRTTAADLCLPLSIRQIADEIVENRERAMAAIPGAPSHLA